MKYGYLFRNYIEDFNHTPTANKCSALNYAELKIMAKNMYPLIKEECNLWNDENPLANYTRMPTNKLSKAVYNALDYLYSI